MEKLDFTTAMRKLEDFYPAIKMNNENKIKAWFEKLEKYSSKSLNMAVNTLIETSESTPTFGKLLGLVKVFNSREPKHNKIKFEQITQGLAPMTEQKRAFISEMMREFWQAFNIKDKAQRAIEFEGLKDVYKSGFKTLPNYKTKAQCQQLFNDGQFQKLEELGI